MADRFIISHIKRLPMFQTLPDAAVERLADLFRVLRLEPGEMVFRQWQVSQGLYMFVSGQGVLIQQRQDGTQQQLGVIGPNQFLNETSLTRENVEAATLHITQTAIVLFLSRHDYQAFVSQPMDTPAASMGTTAYASPTVPLNPNAGLPDQRMGVSPPPVMPTPTTENRRLPAQPPRTFENVPREQRAPAASQDARPSLTNVRPQSQAAAAPTATTGAEEAEAIGKVGRVGVSPEAKTFAGQRQNEQVILMTHRHWIAWIRRSALAILIAGLLFFAATIVPEGPFAFLIVVITFLLPVAMIVYAYINWRDDWLIITNERILHVEQMWITFSTRVSELQLKAVQSINADYPHNDPLAYYFKYGNLDINTAGSTGNIQMDFIPDPDGVKDLIFAHRDQITSQESQIQQRQQIKAVMDAKLGDGQFIASQTATPPPAPPSEHGLFSTHYINAKGEMVYRKHLLFWARKIIIPVMLIFGALMLAILGITTLKDAGLIVFLLAFVMLLVGVAWVYYADWDWRNDLYIIGENTLTLVHKRPFFAQDEDEQLTLDRVDNIQTERSGLLRRIFNYGDVKIQLLGDTTPHIFKKVPNPQTIREEISRRQAQRDQRAKAADLRRQREDVVEAIKLYHEEYGSPPPADFNEPPPSPPTVTRPSQQSVSSKPRFRGRR